MKTKITFWKLLGNWVLAAIILDLINTLFIKSTIVNSLILASLGIILLIFPVYPQNMESKWTANKCRLFIRILAVIEIILAFATRTNIRVYDVKGDNDDYIYALWEWEGSFYEKQD